MSGKYSLLYFDLTGRGEPIRLLFKHAGVDFEDKRVSFEEFGKIRTDKNVTPTGFLPVLTTPCGKKLVQTTSIIRYVANELNLSGSDNVQKAVIDSIVVTIKEILDQVIDIVYKTKEEDKKDKITRFEEKVKTEFQFFEKTAQENGKDNVFVGDKVSVADVYFLDLIDSINAILPGNKILDSYPLLNKINGNVRSTSNLKEYLSKRK